MRAYVIGTEGGWTVVLPESGRVRFVGTDRIQEQLLCPQETEIPNRRLWVRVGGASLHVERSLLQNLGMLHRPQVQDEPDLRCRFRSSLDERRLLEVLDGSQPPGT